MASEAVGDGMTCLPREIRLRFSETLKPNFDSSLKALSRGS